MKRSLRESGITLVETLCASAVLIALLAGASLGIVALQKSSLGAKQYATGMNDGSRLVDYISRDLRNAMKVSRRVNGTPVTFVKGDVLELEGTNELAVNVPNYYLANTPDNDAGSTYKTARFSRSQLSGTQTHFGYNTVVEIIGTRRTARYPGNMEVRYLRKARSGSDPVSCIFRQEYESGTLVNEQEIAERVESAKLTIVSIEKQTFRITCNFASKWTGEASRIGARQFVTVQLFNFRKD
jgi:hypothetical protein